MKKRILFTVLCFIMCIIFTACGTQPEVTPSESDVPNKTSEISEISDEITTEELKAPVMEWWELYNPNGFDTLTAVITNPNEVAVDVSYDLVFYKSGTEVSRIEGCFNEGIAPGTKDVIWANFDVPSSVDADDVLMENIFVAESAYPPVNGTYEYKGVTDGEAYYDFKFEKPITLATIQFLLYNDNNDNKQCDKGEIVVNDTQSLMEQEGTVSYETEGYDYTDCEVFYKAY